MSIQNNDDKEGIKIEKKNRSNIEKRIEKRVEMRMDISN